MRAVPYQSPSCATTRGRVLNHFSIISSVNIRSNSCSGKNCVRRARAIHHDFAGALPATKRCREKHEP